MKTRALLILAVTATAGGLLLTAASSPVASSAATSTAVAGTLSVDTFNQRMQELEIWKRGLTDRMQALEKLNRSTTAATVADPALRALDTQDTWNRQATALIRDLQGQTLRFSERITNLEDLGQKKDALLAQSVQRIVQLQHDLADTKQNLEHEIATRSALKVRLDTDEQTLARNGDAVTALTDRADLADQKIVVDRKATAALKERIDLTEKNIDTAFQFISHLESK